MRSAVLGILGGFLLAAAWIAFYLWVWFATWEDWRQVLIGGAVVLGGWLFCGVIAASWFAVFVRRHLPNIWSAHRAFWLRMAADMVLGGPVALVVAALYLGIQARRL